MVSDTTKNIIRLIHLSDLHITKKHRFFQAPISFTCFNAIVNLIYKWRDKIDGVLITGDIANTGKLENLEFAKSLLSPQGQDPRILQEVASHQSLHFDIKDKPLILLPGNHDRFNSPTLIPGSKNFDKIFSEHWGTSTNGIRSYLLPNNKNPHLIIVCADFSLESWHDIPTPVLYMGQGKAYPNRLRELVDTTKKQSKDHGDIPVIWATHFPPHNERNNPAGYKLKLNNSEEFIRSAEDAKVKYIMAGHLHKKLRPYNVGQSDEVWINCIGSSMCMEKDEPPSIQVIEVLLKNNRIDKFRILQMSWNGRTFE